MNECYFVKLFLNLTCSTPADDEKTRSWVSSRMMLMVWSKPFNVPTKFRPSAVMIETRRLTYCSNDDAMAPRTKLVNKMVNESAQFFLFLSQFKINAFYFGRIDKRLGANQTINQQQQFHFKKSNKNFLLVFIVRIFVHTLKIFLGGRRNLGRWTSRPSASRKSRSVGFAKEGTLDLNCKGRSYKVWPIKFSSMLSMSWKEKNGNNTLWA